MSTLKYKATERYSTGWTDPRGVLGQNWLLDSVTEDKVKFKDVPTETLRNLWLAAFGDAPVSQDSMREHHETDDDIFWVAYQLYKRKLVQRLELSFPDRTEVFTGYALTKEA